MAIAILMSGSPSFTIVDAPINPPTINSNASKIANTVYRKKNLAKGDAPLGSGSLCPSVASVVSGGDIS